jgi:hypothetical protein
LVCTPGDSGLPFGDVGGTCEPARDAACIDTVLCIQGDAWDLDRIVVHPNNPNVMVDRRFLEPRTSGAKPKAFWRNVSAASTSRYVSNG